MTNHQRYILEPYKSGGSNRFVCPQCGQRKCFTRYIDTETGEYVADECGKCDHEASCGYHCPPRQYFQNHHYERQTHNWQPFVIENKTTVLGRMETRKVVVEEKGIQTEFFDLDWVAKATKRDCPFKRWFMSLPFDAVRIQKVLEDYYVGANSNDVKIRGINYGKAVIFWMIDEQMRVHDAKLMAYKIYGHRVPDWGSSMRAVCIRSGIGPQLNSTDKVLFGLHLITRHPDKVVCIVESEKTALVCACRYPEYIWLATGGCGNLQSEKLLQLMDRQLVIFPDSGEFAKWSECMKKSGHRHYKVVDFFEQYEANTDIADVILGEAVLKNNANCDVCSNKHHS